MQVDLACKILDGAPFRDDPARTLTVQPAKFEMRGEQFVPKKKPNKKKPKKDAAKVDKALGWGGFDDQLNPTKVLRPCFTYPLSPDNPANVHPSSHSPQRAWRRASHPCCAWHTGHRVQSAPDALLATSFAL